MRTSDPCPVYDTQTIVNAFGLDAIMEVQNRPGNVPRLQVRNAAAKDGASDQFNVNDELGWFDRLTGEDKDVALKQMFDCRPDFAFGRPG